MPSAPLDIKASETKFSFLANSSLGLAADVIDVDVEVGVPAEVTPMDKAVLVAYPTALVSLNTTSIASFSLPSLYSKFSSLLINL